MEGLSNFERDVRPWGAFERFTLNENTTVKIITVKAGEAFSLQTHAHRKEVWRILSGSGSVTVGDTKTEAIAGKSFCIEAGVQHRAEAGTEDLQFLEIAFGEFDEGDITRLEDKYGRT
ncbi:MAG: phosphomannose isomerase type II C-terminal cupin domain [Candidatus Pacebacteria bacterium]|nr:phosphomannose isomerase type II C-terminal cupin domain [Candidatus Paceibacterota bacterium]